MNKETNVSKGHKAYREGRLNDSLAYYLKAIEENPEFSSFLGFNIDLIKNKFKSESAQNYTDINIGASHSLNLEQTEQSKQFFIKQSLSGCTKTVLISMVKNEGVSIAEWLSHVLSLFDEIHIVDHGSTDGTRSLLKKLADVYPKLRLYYYDQSEYFQFQIMTYIVKSEVKFAKNDWVFFLDADEFLPFTNKLEFFEKMHEYRSHTIVKFPWRNLIPENYDNNDFFNKNYLKPYSRSNTFKISFQPANLKETEFQIEQGNHHLLIQGQRIEAITAFDIFHIPIRSLDQISTKIKDGVSAYRAMNEHGSSNGFHWFEIARYFESKSIHEDDLNGIAFIYSEKGESIVPMSNAKLKEKGCTSFKLSLSTLNKESIFVNLLESVYLNSNVNLNPALSIKNLFVDATKKVSTSFVEYKPVLSVDTARNFKLYKIHIIDKEYYLPDNYFYDKADIDAAIILCKKQILNFLGTRSISSGTYVIDYLDTPPLHTIFVANLLKNCKIIRFCKNTEEAGYLRLLCQYNSIENIGIITPDVAKSEVFEKMKYLTDTLIFPIQKVDFKDVSFKDILILGSSNRLDVDVNINFLLANSSLTCSLFYVENNLIQNSWRLSKPSNIYSFNPSNSFSRSEFETGAYKPRKAGLDIVVAMYNTPIYIIECVNSLLMKGRDDINVIIVNDGSTDNSLEVVNQFYSSHPRVKIISKKNGGCASARNYGRLHSTATHITFVDSDDFIDEGMFSDLYDLALYTGAEITQGGFDFYDDTATQQYTSSYEDELFFDYPREEFRGNQVIRIQSRELICGQPTIWRRVYRRDFIDSKNIFFPENVRAYDDYIFHMLSLYYARDIYMIPKIKLHYRQHAAQDIKQGDERHFYEIYMFKQLLRRSLEEGWGSFDVFIPSIINTINWSLQSLRQDLIAPFALAAAKYIWCLEKVYGVGITQDKNLSVIDSDILHQELLKLRNDREKWHESYVWAYIEHIDNHSITLSMFNAVK